jgi:rare lipoprotein A
MLKINVFAIASFFTIGLAFLGQPFLIQSCDSKPSVSDTLKITFEDTLVYFKKDVVASYYHKRFHGKKTASGEIFSNDEFTAAHKTLPFGTLLRVINVANQKEIVVRVNDRGPFSKTKEIDLSKAAFIALANSLSKGHISVHIQEIK